MERKALAMRPLKFNCEICNVSFAFKKQIIKHNTTAQHKYKAKEAKKQKELMLVEQKQNAKKARKQKEVVLAELAVQKEKLMEQKKNKIEIKVEKDEKKM